MTQSIITRSFTFFIVAVAFAINAKCGYCLQETEKQAKGAEKNKDSESSDEDVSPTGTWTWTRNSPGGTTHPVLTLKEKKGKVTGTYKDEKNEYEVKDGSFDNGNVEFVLTIGFQDEELDVLYSGDVGKDSIEGTLSMEFNGQAREYPWKPKRKADEDGGIVGKWQITFETPDGEMNPVFEVSKGKKEGDFELSFSEGLDGDVDNVIFMDEQLSFEMETIYQEQPLSVTYDLDLDGDELTGYLNYEFTENGNAGELEVIGKRLK